MDKIMTWLDPRIPIEYITVSFLILCLAILIGFTALKGRWIKRFVLISIVAEYYFLVLCTTVICRTETSSTHLELRPFWNYGDIWNKTDYPQDLIEVCLNVVLFMPIGMLLAGILGSHSTSKTVMTGAILSTIVEISQFATQRGLCETDDVIHNTLGCLLGYLIAIAIGATVKRIHLTDK